MFLTVTPNICIERTVLIEDFERGRVHRVPPEKLTVTAGGKGINAARVSGVLGCETLATGWVGQRQAAWFERQLSQEGITHRLVEVEADTRVCVNVIDGAGGTTEIVEAGQTLGIDDGTRLLERVTELLPSSKLLAVCGSYPPAATSAFETHLALLVRTSRRWECPILVDGKGSPLEMAVRSGMPPWCIKPNLDEAAQLLHRPIVGEKQEIRAIRDILKFGVEVVLLSCGDRGAYVGTAGAIWVLQAPKVREVSPVGSGDAFVGAFAAKFLETKNLLEAARWGVAAGAANATQIAAACCSELEIKAMLPQVGVGMRF